MGSRVRNLTVLGVALSASFALAGPAPKMTIYTYNYAQVSGEVLSRAEGEAARIYHQIGIETKWLDCPLSPEEASRFPACQAALGPSGFALRILSRAMGERLKLGPDTFGFAQLPEDGGFGFAASVCSYCAEELAQGREALQAVILGHLMAHELGHLLLGAGSHSSSGIMHVPWESKELERLEQGTLVFTSWQASQMRTQLHRRMRPQRTETVAQTRESRR